jgi:hypothetical protein
MKNVAIKYYKWMALPTKTEEMDKTKRVIFIITLFNTSFLILLAGGTSQLSQLFSIFGRSQGKNPDFTSNWYH